MKRRTAPLQLGDQGRFDWRTIDGPVESNDYGDVQVQIVAHDKHFPHEILIGMNRPVHVLERGADVQEIVNMAAVAVIDSQARSTPG